MCVRTIGTYRRSLIGYRGFWNMVYFRCFELLRDIYGILRNNVSLFFLLSNQALRGLVWDSRFHSALRFRILRRPYQRPKGRCDHCAVGICVRAMLRSWTGLSSQISWCHLTFARSVERIWYGVRQVVQLTKSSCRMRRRPAGLRWLWFLSSSWLPLFVYLFIYL